MDDSIRVCERKSWPVTDKSCSLRADLLAAHASTSTIALCACNKYLMWQLVFIDK